MIANGKVPHEVIPISFGVVIPKRDNKDRTLGLREGLANLAINVLLHQFVIHFIPFFPRSTLHWLDQTK